MVRFATFIVALLVIGLGVGHARGLSPNDPFTWLTPSKTCGFDCENFGGQSDGCLGSDERFSIGGYGKLELNQRINYTYPTGAQEGGALVNGAICHVGRTFNASISSREDVEIRLYFIDENEIVYSTVGQSVCLLTGSTGRWFVEIINIGSKAARDTDFFLNTLPFNVAC